MRAISLPNFFKGGGTVSRSFITTTVWEPCPRSHPPVARVEQGDLFKFYGYELATNGIQFYAIANLDKTSLTDIAAGLLARRAL